jgi:hypothetical protein
MALTYGFFDAVYDSDTGTYDRTYTAEQMSLYFKGLVSDGVIANVGNMMAVTPGSGMAVQVGTGRMLIDSRWLQNSSALNISISAAHATLNRKDIIVARLDYSGRAIGIIAKTGTASASPAAPGIVRNSEYFEMELAEIYVSAGATAITAANITDKRADTSVCGYVTGLVDQIDTTEMWSQLEGDFNEWFDGMKGQLTTDAAGNLQTEIDALDTRVSTNTQVGSTALSNIATINSKLTNLTGSQSSSVQSGDFNTFTTPGAYQCVRLNGMTNAPYGGGYGILEVVKARDYILQRFTYMALQDTYYVFMRTSPNNGATWKPWRRTYINS